MSHFFDTTETVAEGMGFSLFGSLHIKWLVVCVVTIAVCCIFYRQLQTVGRKHFRKIIAWLLVADELFKMAVLFLGGNYNFTYLPLHLCSINIFIIAVHAYKPCKLLDNFLYTVCIPGALASMLFPSWASLPITAGMHWHSFTVHILLMLYPIVLSVNGDIKPELKSMPKSLGLLAFMAVPIYGINLLLDTNFMFLMYAEPGNPLYLFEQMWGSHLWGFPVIITGVMIVMFGFLELFKKIHKKAL